ncbi:NUDIX hydrolase [Nonomuraea sp. NN258]|nr:NUDIX hydrolase [Nonomuraea antri]
MVREFRAGAYALCVDQERILLARWVAPDGRRWWTLPGGGIDHGEDPVDAVVREVAEETGLIVTVESLLGVDTVRRRYDRGAGREADFHGLRIFYAAAVVGGTLRDEVGGSTDRAAWLDLADLPGLDQADLVGIGLELLRVRPPHGRLPK